MKNIEALWAGYKKTIPASTPPAGMAAAEIDFYCGATALFCAIAAKLENRSLTSEEGSVFLYDITQEIDEFMSEMTDTKRTTTEKEAT